MGSWWFLSPLWGHEMRGLNGKFAAQRWIANVVGRLAWKVVALCVLQAALAGLGIVFALVMRSVIDEAVAGDAAGFASAAVAFALVIGLQLACRAITRRATEGARASVENAVRARAFKGILTQDYRTVSAHHSGALMSRLTSDVAAVTDGVTQFIPAVVSMAVRIVGALAVLFTLVPLIAGVFVAAGACMGLASIALRGRMKRLHKDVQEAESDVRSFLQECLESLLIVHAFGREDKMARINQDNMSAHRRARMRRNNMSNACNVGVGLAVQGSYLLGFLWCGWGILQGTVSYGTLMAVVQLIGQIQSPFASMGSTFSKYSAMLASAERLMEVAEGERASERGGAGAYASAADERGEAEGLVRSGVDVGTRATCPFGTAAQLYDELESIAFENVSFRYGRDEVLSGLSLDIARGEFVALAGQSGVGKSTAVKLLLAAQDAQAGRVVLRTTRGAVDVACAPAGLFAYVPQGNFLMSGTIREVISFSEEPGVAADEDRLREACFASCADGFISDLPRGLDTLLGERGSGLSEGQMQRLAVARAVYSGAPILLLDEATSALDAVTEERMLKRLRDLPDRTAVVVTHRSEAMAVCDRVIRLSRGRADDDGGAARGCAVDAEGEC